MKNLRKLGLALFALAIIIFLTQGYVLNFVNRIASLTLPEASEFYESVLESYYVIFGLLVALVIMGVVFFYKGGKQDRVASSDSVES